MWRGVTIETDPSVRPEQVINALGKLVTATGPLMLGGGLSGGIDYSPRLDLRAGWPGSLTFVGTQVTSSS